MSETPALSTDSFLGYMDILHFIGSKEGLSMENSWFVAGKEL